MLTYYLHRLLGLVVPLIPPGLGYPLAARLGDLFYCLEKVTRADVCDNVTHILGGRQKAVGDSEAIVRGVFHNMAKNYYDLFRVPTLSLAEIARLVKIEGWEHVERVLSKGKGLILVTAHFGNTDIVAQVLTLREIPVVVPAEHLKPEVLFQYICSLRASKGLRLIPIDGPLLGLFRALRRNEAVGLAADRDITESGLVVDFFGAPARLPDGYAQLSLRTGAPIIVGFGQRLSDNTFVAHLEPPLELETTGDRARDVRAGVEKVVAIMERYIGEHPEQWVMSVPLWQMANS
ncbi:MAG: lysophospholipid acyltransferase family protein [Anaerolineae bacterium]